MMINSSNRQFNSHCCTYIYLYDDGALNEVVLDNVLCAVYYLVMLNTLQNKKYRFESNVLWCGVELIENIVHFHIESNQFRRRHHGTLVED